MIKTLLAVLHLFTLGDSNGSFPYSWPMQLQQHASVFNISKSGRTIGFVNNGDSSLNSLLVIDENLQKAAAQGVNYDYVILQLGTNDAKAVFADRQAEVPLNMERLIRKIKDCPYPAINKARIIIIAPPPYGIKADTSAKYRDGNKRVEQMSKAFAAIAERNGCLFVDGYRTPGLNIETMTTDGLHLDAAGSRKLIEPVLNLILPAKNRINSGNTGNAVSRKTKPSITACGASQPDTYPRARLHHDHRIKKRPLYISGLYFDQLLLLFACLYNFDHLSTSFRNYFQEVNTCV